MKPYIILSPKYRHNSAGIRVLYSLYTELQRRGQDTYLVNNVKEFPRHIDPSKSIAVYPEIYKGNPLNTKDVARYVLYIPGVICDGDKIYNENEMVFSYSEIYLDFIKNKVLGLLYLDTTDLTIFKNVKRLRTQSCFFVGKGRGNFNEGLIPKNCIEITNKSPKTREGVAHLFNMCSLFYCFDPATVMMQEAALCGCPTLLLSNNHNHHRKTMFGLNGVATKPSEIDEAVKTVPLILGKLLQIKKRFETQIDAFIQITQER